MTLAMRPDAPPRVAASPLARRTARAAGLDLAAIAGSGPNGRVVEKDVRAALARPPAATPVPPTVARGEAPAPVPPPIVRSPEPEAEVSAAAVRRVYAGTPHEAVPLDGMRRAIARRVTLAQRTVPQFALSAECRVDALNELRAALNAAAPARADGTPAFRLTLNDLLVKALALALQRVPEANVIWAEDALLRFARSDVGVMVAVPGGIVTPVVRAADTLSLAALSAEIRTLASRAREGRATAADLAGGVTAVSNLGMRGAGAFQAIVDPPRSTVLAVGAVEERIVARAGAPVLARMATVTLTADHRAIDGAVAADLVAAFRRLVETPIALAA